MVKGTLSQAPWFGEGSARHGVEQGVRTLRLFNGGERLTGWSMDLVKEMESLKG